MASGRFLDNAKVMCQQLVVELLPEEAAIFDDAWRVLLPLFEKWLKSKPRERRFLSVDFPVAGGLGFGDARDWGLPIAIMTAVAAMLEMLEAGEDYSKSGVRGSVAKYANVFGAPAKLNEILIDKVPPFCLEVYHELAKAGGNKEKEKRKRRIDEAMPVEKPSCEYAVLTHRDESPVFMNHKQLKAFERKNKPRDYDVWVDETEGKVFVKGKLTPLGYRMRKVLRNLLKHKGKRVLHSQLVVAVRGKRSDDDPKTSRRWIISLWKAGKGQLRKYIRTRERGFSFEESATFCVIKSRWED